MDQPELLVVDHYRFTANDARRTFANLGELWRMHVMDLAHVPDTALATIGVTVARLESATGDNRPSDDPGEALDHLGAVAAERVTDGVWAHDLAEAELAAAWNGIRGVGRDLRRAGVRATEGTGTVHQLNTSDGGVPKLPIERAEIDWSGVAGDRQAARQHHGRPWQALCLWSLEVIQHLAQQGHPIHAGAAGENVTISGLDWSLVRPGAILDVGTARCEVSAYALPCSKNSQWFLGRDHDVMHHRAGPVSRVYATVIKPGHAHTGDAVSLTG